MEKKVSVIIPVYNVENYLAQCVNSVLDQTYPNIEIILVDDGSTDKSGNMCDDFQQKDHRIRVIHQKNSGLSEARNQGTALATGEYIFYLDSDDYVDINMIEKLINLAETHNCDVVSGNYYYTYSDHEQIALKNEKDYEIFEPFLAMSELVQGNKLRNFAWGKLIKTGIAQKYKFPKGKLFEDMFWTHYIIADADKVGIEYTTGVHYRQRDNSISYTFKPANLDQLDGMLERKAFLQNKYEVLLDEYYPVMAQNALNLCWCVIKYLDGQVQKDGINKLKAFCQTTHLMEQKCIDRKQRELITAFCNNVMKYKLMMIKNKVIEKISRG